MVLQTATKPNGQSPGKAPVRKSSAGASSPKNGALLGRKGKATKKALMDAASRLLTKVSPMSLSAAAISKEAGTSPATFYVYFENVEDILWALCSELSQDTSKLFPHENFLRDDARLEEDALEFVTGYCDIWANDGLLMLYRNMEADRGNKRFNELVLKIGLPILQGLTDRIVEAAPADHPISRHDANAEAVVFIAAMDKIAAALHLWPEESLTPETLLGAEVRVLVRMLRRR